MINTGFPEKWQEKWQKDGFSQMAPIQAAVYEPLKAGESLVGIAPTGSGKTLAYLWPLLQNVEAGSGNQLLVLTSSQELAMQVTEVARNWGSLLQLKVQALIGGANSKRQVEKLKDKPEVLVGTPGRVLELMKQKKVKAHLLQTVVLDEVDQLLQAGASQIMTELFKTLPRNSQLAFFSATGELALPEIREMRPEIQVVDVSAEDNTQGTINHFYLKFPLRRKVDALRRLGNLKDFKALVFFNALADMGAAEEKLTFHQVPVMSLASDQNKVLRKAALTGFREGKVVELLTTDVAARGLDIEGLDYVVNFEVPMTAESYTHRSGRVGRMGRSGTVLTIISDEQLRDLKKLTKESGITLSEVYLHGGLLTTEAPSAEETVFSKKLEIHQKLHTKENKKIKKQRKSKKNQKDKGKRRS